MSWCGGGEISPTPGVECRSRAMRSSTLWPGSWPPSPGFAPWAILICSWSASTRYGAVTPKRADATCLLAEPVHRDRQRLVGLGGDRAQAHRAGGEALDDVGRRLDLLQRHWLGVGRELEQAAQRRELRALPVDRLGEGLVRRVVVVAHGPLQAHDRVRVPVVVLATQALLVLAAGVELRERPACAHGRETAL